MPIVETDIQWRYSGGATNADPNACLGGAISTAAGGSIDNLVKNDLFDDVSSAESTTGDTEYRGFYVKNNHATLTLEDARVFISADSASTSDIVDIALSDEAVNVAMETILNENTAPVGPVFSHPTTYSAGLQLDGASGLTAGSFRGVWIRRTVSLGAPAGPVNDNTLKVEGQTS